MYPVVQMKSVGVVPVLSSQLNPPGLKQTQVQCGGLLSGRIYMRISASAHVRTAIDSSSFLPNAASPITPFYHTSASRYLTRLSVPNVISAYVKRHHPIAYCFEEYACSLISARTCSHICCASRGRTSTSSPPDSTATLPCIYAASMSFVQHTSPH
jgi:hypothetical protein